MVRTQVQLTEKQAEVLKRVAAREGVSVAEVIRRAVDHVVGFEQISPDMDELRRRALAVAGTLHSDVDDLSVRHDDYFAEAIDSDRIR